jgi:periplasmic nitrate reductase NapE
MSARTTEDMLIERRGNPEHGSQRKKEEFRTWLFLALILAPVLAVLIVSAYGFGVWIFQLIAGPPG